MGVFCCIDREVLLGSSFFALFCQGTLAIVCIVHGLLSPFFMALLHG